MSGHVHHCSSCLKTAAKWGAALYVAHWVLHAIVFMVSPTLGAILLTIF